MPYIAYEEKNMRDETLHWIRTADKIANDYAARGLDLTLRQLYYQLVTRNFFENNEKNYDKLGRVVSDGRLNGLIDWNHLEDRGRESYGTSWHGHVPVGKGEMVRNAKYGYSLDLWKGQERRIEIWVEKQALEQVAERAANKRRVGYFACKGYVSQSEMWLAGRRMQDVFLAGQEPLVLHLGDHDPSGMDMTRDIQERLSLFAGTDIEVKRIALNMDQVAAYNPPPNPAKLTDSRAPEYVRKYGRESWELDALRPEVLIELIGEHIDNELDFDMFNRRVEIERYEMKKFDMVANAWESVVDSLDLDGGDSSFYEDDAERDEELGMNDEY